MVNFIVKRRIALFLFLLNFGFNSTSAEASERFDLPIGEGRGVDVFLKCPNAKPGKKYPLIFLLGGFQTGARAIELLKVTDPLCLATLQYPFEGPRKLHFGDALKYLPEAKRAVHETLAGIHATVDWAKARNEIDPERIVFVGASFGAPFFSIVAGERSDVAALILVHGFVNVPDVISFRLGKKLESKLGFLGRGFGWLVSRILWAYANVPSPERSLMSLHSRQKVLIFTAENDDLLPPDSAEILREALRASQAKWEEQKLPGQHLRPDETELIGLILRRSLVWLKANALLR